MERCVQERYNMKDAKQERIDAIIEKIQRIYADDEEGYQKMVRKLANVKDEKAMDKVLAELGNQDEQQPALQDGKVISIGRRKAG